MNTEMRSSDSAEHNEPTRRWVRRTETIAAFVLAVLFIAWVGTVFVRQRLTGRGIDVVRSSAGNSRYKVDLNMADKGELMLLPGIGDVRSERILAWRSERGRFQSLDEVKAASGLSDNGLEAIRDLITLGEPERE